MHPSHPSSPSDSSGQAIASDSQWLPGVSCSGATTAWSLAKEVIKQLSFSYCLWVSLLSRPQASLSVPTLCSSLWHWSPVCQFSICPQPPRTTLF